MMSGFVVLIESHSHPQARKAAFRDLLQLTASYKRLELPGEEISGRHCDAAKLDSPSSLHQGVVEDAVTGSWLLAAGTLVNITEGSRSGASLDTFLRDYLENGQGALQRYDGHFALVIYDGRDESLCVISDPLGYFSVFYSTWGNKTFVSTSALAVAKLTRAKPNVLAAECFLRTGQVYGNATLWRGVKRLLPAPVLKFAKDCIGHLHLEQLKNLSIMIV